MKSTYKNYCKRATLKNVFSFAEETQKVIDDTDNGKNCASFDSINSIEELFNDLKIK